MKTRFHIALCLADAVLLACALGLEFWYEFSAGVLQLGAIGAVALLGL